MPREFCEHLSDYGSNWIRAEASYVALTRAMERILDQGASDDHLDLLEVALGDWKYEVKQLRQRFVNLVRQGVIGLPENQGSRSDDSESGAPACADCGFTVPKLSWPEWDVQEAGAKRFRGTVLPTPQAVA